MGTYLDKPWLKSYLMGPYKLEHSLEPYPELPLFHSLDQAAENYPSQTAVLYQGKSLKYHQLKRRVDSLSNGLSSLGIEKGDRVCLFLSNSPEFILSYWAVLKCGAVVVPTSILRTDDGLLHELNTSSSKLIICQRYNLDRALAAREKSQLENILLSSNGADGVEETENPLPPGVFDLQTLIGDHDPQPPQVEVSPREDLCELVFTGGATGVPKGVMLSHYNRSCAVRQLIPWMMKPMLKGIAGKTSVLIAIPLFHVFGNFVHQSAVHLGLRMIILPDPRDTDTMVKNILEHRPFLIPGVPTQFMHLAEAGLKRTNSMFFSGAAPLPLEVAQMVKSKTGIPISEGYALTETSAGAHVNLSAFSRITGFMPKEIPGVGVPTPDTECRLVDPASGEDATFGEPGEVLLKGPQVMLGYWPDIGSGLTNEGWLHTGDIGIMDEDGYFRIVDRLKDMVNISGMKVYTTQVDEVLFKHPAVLMAAAFGVPDPSIPGSERVMAVIRLKEGHLGQVGEGEIRDYCRQHLPPYAVPTYVEFHDDLPLTVTEKVFKKALREEAIDRMKSLGKEKR